MAKNNELDKYIKKAKKDDKNAYRMIINYLWDEIYNLAGFLCDADEQEKVTKRLFVVAYRHIKEYDENECDIHLWMAREATKELYSMLCESGEEIFPEQIDQKDYDFSSIDEDDELGEASAEFNEAFLGEGGFDSEEACFASMTAGEKIIYLLYCYESYNIDEIETIMNIDSSFITSEIASMREGVLAAYAPIKTATADEDEDALEDAEDEEVDEAAEDDDIDILDDERPVKSTSRPVKAQDKKEYAIGNLQFTEKQFKGVILGVFAVLLVIVIIIIVAVVSAHNGNNNITATTKALTTQATSAQGTTAQNAETTGETQETSAEEETTARRVQSGTQPNVEINTTEAPTQASTEGATQAATTKAAETTAATTTQAATTVAPTTTAEATTAQTTTAEATTAQTTTAAPAESTTAAETTSTAAGAQAVDAGNTSGSTPAP
jgi:DNA-directed RNA polymerase specialized sigma24 family protein